MTSVAMKASATSTRSRGVTNDRAASVLTNVPVRIPDHAPYKEIYMCQRITCSTCHKPSFAGCGMHVEQVLRDVPSEQRCTCGEERAGAKSAPRSFLERLPGRSSSRP
jgi:hypothetical protein